MMFGRALCLVFRVVMDWLISGCIAGEESLGIVVSGSFQDGRKNDCFKRIEGFVGRIPPIE